MEVILLERIEKLGQMGDVVKVKDGFARNYLIPQKKALRASENNLEYYASYLYIENLFNEKCIDKALMKDYSFIKIFFKYGFLPVYNYKSILN